MLTIANLEQFTKQAQTNVENVVREYCQHAFLSFLYQQPGSEKLLFKGGTALRVVFHSPRYSEDLDFTGLNIAHKEIEKLFTNTLAQVERTGMEVDVIEGKPTTGGYLGTAVFEAYGKKTRIQIEVSLRKGKRPEGVRRLIDNEYIPPYSLIILSEEQLVQEKLDALSARHKPRDFYDYYFLLSGNYSTAKRKENLELALKLLRESEINFQTELKKFLPASHAAHMRDFNSILERQILTFLE